MFIILLLSCNNDDSDSNSNAFFNPPTWIQGKWLVDDPIIVFGFEFTNDNFIINQMGAKTNYGEILKMHKSIGSDVSTNERITDDEYEVKINSEGTSTVYKFKKRDQNTIEHLNTNFYKQ